MSYAAIKALMFILATRTAIFFTYETQEIVETIKNQENPEKILRDMWQKEMLKMLNELLEGKNG